jgi:hypothetical protein
LTPSKTSAGIERPANIAEVKGIERWGPIFDNAERWLQKVRNMLDPNRVANWSGYIPPEYAKDKIKGEKIQ